jgi:ADP-heptose:LPS heptosyltransferase
MSFDLIIKKFYNLIRYSIYLILDFIISFNKQTIKPNTLLLIKLDSIGDYLLFRNYLEYIKKSEKFKDYKITLLGNIIWKELAETFDVKIIDNFIWLERQKFNNNIFYKFKLLNSIYNYGFETVIECSYSREILFGDSIVKTSRAMNRIGSIGSPDGYVKWKRNLLTDKFYTKLIPSSNQIMFEFERNKEYFSKILNVDFDMIKPVMNTDMLDRFDFEKEYIVVFPGANHPKRIWSAEKFAKVIDHLSEKYNYEFVIAGSEADSGIAEEILRKVKSEKIENLTGKTTLPQLAKLISDSTLLISNETSAIHFAAAVNTPFVCISNGNHFGRFHPYPKEMGIKAIFIYPREIMDYISNQDYLKSVYGFGSELDINSINENEVISEAEKLLTKE